MGSGKKLDESTFVDWYVRMIFATGEDEDAEEGEGEGEGGLSVDEDGAGAGGSCSKAPKSAPATGFWAGVKWAVAPTGASSVAGKMWKCDKCYMPNPWEQAKCLVRESATTHVAELAGPRSGPGHCGRAVARGGLDSELGLYFRLPGRGRGL
jgi:hypothetical protein